MPLDGLGSPQLPENGRLLAFTSLCACNRDKMGCLSLPLAFVQGIVNPIHDWSLRARGRDAAAAT